MPRPPTRPKMSKPVSPGSVWVGGDYLGTAAGADPIVSGSNPSSGAGIQEWQADSGKILRTIDLPQVSHIADIKIDGSYLWVLAAKRSPAAQNYCTDSVFALSLSNGSVVKELNTQGNNTDCAGTRHPVQIGLSPGKLWVDDEIIDTQTFQVQQMGPYPKSDDLPDGAYFAYGGQQWMWSTGEDCAECSRDLWLFNTMGPAKLRDEYGTGATTESHQDQAIIAANGKVWVGAKHYPADSEWLEAYDINKPDKPVLNVDISKVPVISPSPTATATPTS